MYYRSLFELKNFFFVKRTQFQLKTFFWFYFNFVFLLHFQTAQQLGLGIIGLIFMLVPAQYLCFGTRTTTLLHDIEKLVNKTINGTRYLMPES